ncbi:hypothetical protein P154DRAFT_445456 [Amniculicola lignicola CBS 123094]|uniref:Rhodopsin domain-containing protein n=1 Tax=Amniculicola lignicola CBS 123094 TaxID=1392246 RepID=A0A6A5W2G3_9PLEO|nr:hypothetical protein P154DRAFT_445456 [Amniculicola lignicola CBS 123094]
MCSFLTPRSSQKSKTNGSNRYYCRYFRMGTIGATDHLMLTALILTWGNTTVNWYQDLFSSRFRPSQFRRPEKRPMIEDALRGTLITWYTYRMTYTIALCFVKLSILFFYRAIASQRTFRRFVNFGIGTVIVYTFAASLAAGFQCENPSDAWSTDAFLSQFDGVPGRIKKPKCYDPTRLWVFTSAFNLFSDVVILLLPIPTLLSLRVPMNKRLALIGIFSVGIMAIVASCVRMWVMALWSESPQNSAKFGSDLLLWGQVETNSGIISASVPFLRLIFRRSEKKEVSDIKPRAMVIGPPRPIAAAHIEGEGFDFEVGGDEEKRMQIESLKFFEAGEGDRDWPEGMGWQPFITVPESLSSGSRGSAYLEPTKVHMTV